MKLILLILISLQLLSCASTNKTVGVDKSIDIYLMPEVDQRLELTQGAQATHRASIIDNDANTYNTFWYGSESDEDVFQKRASYCRDKLSGIRYFPGMMNISSVTGNDLQPVMYKSFVSCIYDFGYEFFYSEAFAPRDYRIVMQRINTSTDQFLPVTANLMVSRPKARLRELYQDVSNCRKILWNSSGSMMVEKVFKGAIFVNIEPLAREMMQCLQKKFYKVELLPEKITPAK